MSEAQIEDFQQRIGAISREHKKLSHGYVELVERDGLLVPKRKRRMRRSMPIKPMLLTVAGFLLLKGFIYSQVGALSYGDRVDMLSAGNAAEKVGASMMQAGPVTIWIAEQINSVL